MNANVKREDLINNFVTEVLCENNKHNNACVYSMGFYYGAIAQEVVFENNHKEQYKKLLMFCAENGLVISSTHHATYATIVLIDGIE